MNKLRIIEYSKDAVKFIKKQDINQKKRIRTAIDGLKEIPMRGDIKPLEGYKDGRYRLRIGIYRIIFKIVDNDKIEIIYIMDIGSRGDIYK